MKKLIVGLMMVFVLSGCVTSNLPAEIDYNGKSSRLSQGMNKQQVTSIMGTPRRTEMGGAREQWHYWNNTLISNGFRMSYTNTEALASNKVTVTFKNNKVVSWGQNDALSMSLELVAEMQAKAIEVRNNQYKGK